MEKTSLGPELSCFRAQASVSLGAPSELAQLGVESDEPVDIGPGVQVPGQARREGIFDQILDTPFISEVLHVGAV